MVVTHSPGKQSIPQGSIRQFCRQNEADIIALRLGSDEFVRFIGEGIVLYATSFDINLTRERVVRLKRIFDCNSGPVPVERRFSDKEFGIKLGKTITSKEGSGARHQFGGRLHYPVRCPACAESGTLIARIGLDDPILPDEKLGRTDFPVFWCLDCAEWGPIFFDSSKQQVVPYGKTKPTGKPVPFSDSDLEALSVSLVPVPAGKKAGGKSKLGGSPAWIQSEEIPECPKCKQGMTFVLQLASNSEISFGDMGMLYAFLCRGCKISATLIQSH
jgi:hypothetical protein